MSTSLTTGLAGARAPPARIAVRANARRPSAARRPFLAASHAGLGPSRPIRVVTSQGDRETRTAASDGGNGGDNGGGDNGWGPDGDGDGDGAGFSANVWVLLAAAAGALGLFGTYQKLNTNSGAAKLTEEYDT